MLKPINLTDARKDFLSLYGNNDIEGYFERQDLSDYLLEKFNVDYSTFIQCNMSNSTYKNIIFSSCVFNNCDMSNSKFDNCTFHRCEFISTKMIGTSIYDCIIKDVTFNSNLTYGSIMICKMEDVFFNHCDLTNLSINDNKVKKIGFDKCLFNRTEIVKTPLKGANLVSSTLMSLRFTGTELKGVRVTMQQAALLSLFLGIIID